MKKMILIVVGLVLLAGCASKKNTMKLEESPCACEPIEVSDRV